LLPHTEGRIQEHRLGVVDKQGAEGEYVDLGGSEEEVTGGWRELCNEEFHLFLSPNITGIESRRVSHAV